MGPTAGVFNTSYAALYFCVYSMGLRATRLGKKILGQPTKDTFLPRLSLFRD
ncbi:hypothetical protein BDN70DRAFT_876695, partial [Pholiota conissans]